MFTPSPLGEQCVFMMTSNHPWLATSPTVSAIGGGCWGHRLMGPAVWPGCWGPNFGKKDIMVGVLAVKFFVEIIDEWCSNSLLLRIVCFNIILCYIVCELWLISQLIMLNSMSYMWHSWRLMEVWILLWMDTSEPARFLSSLASKRTSTSPSSFGGFSNVSYLELGWSSFPDWMNALLRNTLFSPLLDSKSKARQKVRFLKVA